MEQEPLSGTFTVTGSCKPNKEARGLGAPNVSTKYVATINFNGITKAQLENVFQNKSSVGVQIDNHIRQTYLNFDTTKPLPNELKFNLTDFMSRGRINVPADVAGRNAVMNMTPEQLQNHIQMIADLPK